MTQPQVAAILGISRQSFVAIESGHLPGVAVALAIARLLGSTVEALFGEDLPRSPVVGPRPPLWRDDRAEVSQLVRFEGSHRLDRPGQPDEDGSRRWHGHSYEMRVFVRGRRDPITGMVVDIGDLRRSVGVLVDEIQSTSMEDVSDLGPGTIENLAAWFHRRLEGVVPGLHRIEVSRDAHGDRASFPIT
jgi:6-pyruvoyltetrahydropterin/6-carboxytetrahydropterin synthase